MLLVAYAFERVANGVASGVVGAWTRVARVDDGLAVSASEWRRTLAFKRSAVHLNTCATVHAHIRLTVARFIH